MDKQDFMKTSDIIKYVEKLTGHVLNKDEGGQHGDSKPYFPRRAIQFL